MQRGRARKLSTHSVMKSRHPLRIHRPTVASNRRCRTATDALTEIPFASITCPAMSASGSATRGIPITRARLQMAVLDTRTTMIDAWFGVVPMRIRRQFCGRRPGNQLTDRTKIRKQGLEWFETLFHQALNNRVELRRAGPTATLVIDNTEKCRGQKQNWRREVLPTASNAITM